MTVIENQLFLDAQLARRAQTRLEGLNLGEGSIHPNYGGGSALNLPASICRWLEVPEIHAPALEDELHAAAGERFTHVILVLMDGLAYRRLRSWMQADRAKVWQRLADAGALAAITSITPSTTAAALTSLWTGRSANEHGITGYEMWLKEYGIVANTILHMPITFKSDLGALERTGFEPEKFVPFTTLGTHLHAHGVECYGLQNHSIADSGLSRMLLKDVQARSFSTAADLWINLRHLLEEKADQRLYAWVYWGELDFFSHFYGPDDERSAAEFDLFSQAMQALFLDQLSAAARKDTLLILTADHGMIATPPDARYDLRQHPDLTRRLHLMPTGENRLAYFYVQPGQIEAVREYIARNWLNQFILLDSRYAVEQGLFGPGAAHPRLLERVGDLIAAAQGDAYFWWADKENRMSGRHGGVHPDEMLVPLLLGRLEG